MWITSTGETLGTKVNGLERQIVSAGAFAPPMNAGALRAAKQSGLRGVVDRVTL